MSDYNKVASVLKKYAIINGICGFILAIIVGVVLYDGYADDLAFPAGVMVFGVSFVISMLIYAFGEMPGMWG